jgi:hypothetical protein
MLNLQEIVRISVGKKRFMTAKEMDSDFNTSFNALKTVSTNFAGGYVLKLYNWGGARQYFVMESEKSRKVLATVHLYRWGDTGWRVESTGVRPTMQGTGIGLKIYVGLIQDIGLTLVSGKKQSVGGEKLWQSLAKQRGIEVYGYDPNAKRNKFFSVDLDDLEIDSPTGTVYINKEQIKELMKNRDEELKSAQTKLERNRIQKAYQKEIEDARRGKSVLLIATSKKGLSKAK